MLLTTRERIIVLCAGTLLGSAIAGVFLFGPPYVYTAQAQTVAYSCDGTKTGVDSALGRQQDVSQNVGTIYATAFWFTCSSTGTDCDISYDGVNAFGFLCDNTGTTTCNAANADAYICPYAGQNVTPSGEWIYGYVADAANCSTASATSLVATDLDSYRINSWTNATYTKAWNYIATDVCAGNRYTGVSTSHTTQDVPVILYSDYAPGYEPDPRPSTVTVYDPPDETELDYYQLAAGAYTFRATSDVSADTYPEYDGTDYWDFRIKNASEEVVWVALLRSTGRLYYDTEAYYAYAIAPSLTLPVGAYTVEARVEWFEDGEAVEISDWATASDFTVSLGGELGGGAGGGGGASWGDEYGGGATDWDTFFASVDDHDTVYGACKLIGWSFTWDTGGSSESSAGDGLPCLWTWIQYALIPPADGFFNYLEYPLNVLLTRWPLAYITTALQSLQNGLATSTACPLPEVGGSSIMGGATIPTVDPCEWFEDVASTVESSTAFVTLAVLGIYASLGLYAASRAREFLSS